MEEQVTPEQVKPEETTTQPPIDNKPDELSQFITSATSELMAARPQSLDTFREVVGNPITGSNPVTKANPFTTSGFAENLDYSASKKLEENSNDYKKMRPYTYSGDYDAANFVRYSSTAAYKHLGFTPYRDNESLYNDKMTVGDTFSRTYSAFTKLVTTGFAGNMATWGDMFTDPLAADEKSARDMKRTVAIGSSTKGGLGGFIANTAMQLGYTVGVAYELALETVALSAITGFTGGLAGEVTVPTMAARLGLGARRLLGAADIVAEAAKNITKGEAVLNAAKAAEQGSEALKNIKNLKNVNEIRSFWNTLPGKVIKKTGEVINPFDDTIKALSKTDYASDLARNLGVFGGFAEDVIQIKTAASEAKLEGGMSKIDITKDLIDEYRRTHNGEDPTGEDLQRIENLADAEARRVTLWNLPAIMTSNKFLHATMLAPINKMMGKVSKSADDLIFTDKTFKVVGDDLISKAKVRAKSLVKPATYGRYSMNYLKVNLAEGIQENIQEALAIGASEHAMATYTDPAKAAYEGYMGSFMSGVKQQFSAQGAETFAGGFVMGMFAQPIIGAPTWTMSKLSDLTINREKAKKFKEEKKAQNERDAATLNELYQNDVNILAPDLKNIITQQGLAKDLYTAVQNSNEKEARDAKYSALHNQISTALRTGKYDIFLDKWKDYKNMSATEIEDAFAQYGVEKGEGQKVLDNIDNIVSRSEKIRNTYENVANEFPNPYNYQSFEKDTPLYKANKNAFIAWEEAKQNLVFAKDSFDNYKERIQSMAKTFSAYAEEIGQTDAQTMMRLLSSKDTLTEVSTLEEEIKVLDDGIPAQASLKKQKQKILDTLLEFETRIEQTQDPSLSEEQKMWAKNKAKETFDRYVKAVSKRNKSILFDDTINKAYSLIFDSRTSNTDMEGLARSINVLSNPKGFLNVQKRIAQAFELLKERAPDIVKNNQKMFDDIVLRNKLHNSLGELGLKFEDEFLEKYDEALKNNTEIPNPTVFINPATGEEIKDGPKFEEAMNLWNTYLDITKKDEEEATKEAETKKAAESVTKAKEFDENDINTFPEQLVDFLKTEFKEAEDLNTTDGRTFDEWLKDDAQIGIIRYFMKEFKGELKEEPVVEKVEEEGKTKEENIEKIISSAKTPQEASLKIWGLGYGFSTEEQERLNNYIKDRFDGKTSQTYAEFSKTEAPATTTTDIEAKKADIERRRQEEHAKIDEIFNNDKKGLYQSPKTPENKKYADNSSKGWKLHLQFKKGEVTKVAKFLYDNNLYFKAHNDVGTYFNSMANDGATIYIGSSEDALKISNLIKNTLGDILEENKFTQTFNIVDKNESVYSGSGSDITFSKGMGLRFDVAKTKHGWLGEKVGDKRVTDKKYSEHGADSWFGKKNAGVPILEKDANEFSELSNQIRKGTTGGLTLEEWQKLYTKALNIINKSKQEAEKDFGKDFLGIDKVINATYDAELAALEGKEKPATPEEVIIPEKAAAVIQPIETAPQALTMTEGDFTVRKLKLQNEIKDLRTEFKAIDKDIEKLEKEKDVLDKALREYSKRSDEVKEIITENITEEEVAAIAEQENISVEQVQEAIVDALFEPKPSKFKEALRNVINKLKKIILGLFLTGTLVTSASAFSFNNDGQVTFSLENAVENLLPEQQEQWAKRYLDKKGLITIADAQIVPEKTQPVVVENPKPEKIFQIIGTVPDSYNPSDSLLSYRSQWDNEDGFKYVPMPVKQDLPKGGMKVNGVLGVGHFLLDASVAEGAVYSFEYNKAFLDKAKKNDHWIPAFKRLEDGNVLLKYKKPADIDKEDIVVSPLRQFKFSDIAFDKTQTPKGFQKGIKEVKTKQGEGTYIIFKDRSGYSRFSGGSVVFIFKDKYDNTIVRDFAGSINQIENEGIMIQSNYNLEPGELTIGYHDVGSFSAKPKAKAGEISSKQWQGFNPGGMTGGALLIPIEGNIKQLPSKPMEKGAASNLIGLLGLAAMIRKKNKASEDLTDSDLEKIKKGLDKINDKIAELRFRSDELKTRYHARIEDKNTLEEDYVAIKARDKAEAPVVYSKKKSIGFEIPIAGNKTAVFNQTDKYFEFLDGKGELITDASRIETAAKKLSENNSYIRLWWMKLLDQPKRDEVLDDITKYYSMLNSIGPETKGKLSTEDSVIYMIMERLAGVKINPTDAKDLTDINRRVWVAPRGTKGKDLDTFVTDELMAEDVPGTYDDLMETVKGIIMTYQDGIKNKDFKEFLRRADPQADIIDFQKNFINKYGLDVDRVSDELERSELLDYKGEPGDTRDIYQPKIEKINKDAFNRLGIKDKFNTLVKELAKEGQIYGTLTDDYPRQLVAGDDEIFQIKLDDGRTVRTTPGKYFPMSFPIPVNKRVLITREIKPINGQQRTVLSVTYNGLDFAYVLENEPKQFRDTSAPDLSVEDLNEQIDDKALSAAKERNYTVSYENINNPEQSGQYFVENVGKDSVSLKSLITKEEVKVPTENIPESIKSINDTEKPVSTTDDVTKVEKNQTITDGVIKDIDNSKSLDEAADDFFENIC